MPNTKIVKNEWEFLQTEGPESTKIPENIRNAADPGVISTFLEEHGAELNEHDKEALTHMRDSRQKIADRITAVKKEVEEGKYAEKKIEPVELEEGSYLLVDLSQPSHQTSANGCWSCFYKLALASRGIDDLSQEDIRAYRPGIDREKDEHFGADADKEMNSDTMRDMLEMGDLAVNLLPDTMIKSVDIWPYRQYLNGKENDNYDKMTYYNSAVAGVKKQILESIRDHHSPVGLMMDGHYVTITGISGDTIYYKDSMPGKDGYEPDHTFTANITTFLDKALNGENASAISLTWLEDIKISREGDILYDVPVYDAKVDEEGQVKLNAKESQNIYGDIRHRDGVMMGITGGTEIALPEEDSSYRIRLKDGFFRIDKAYLPKKLNVDSLRKKAAARSVEEEERLIKARDQKLEDEKILARKIEDQKKIDMQAVLENGEGKQVENALPRFALHVRYVGKPFFGGSSYNDFKNVMVGYDWGGIHYTTLLGALSNIYDPFIERDQHGVAMKDDPQRKAVDILYNRAFCEDQDGPGSVATVRDKLSKLRDRMVNGGKVYSTDENHGDEYELKGLKDLANPPADATNALKYLDAFIKVLEFVAEKLPDIPASVMEIDSFIDENGDIREELLTEQVDGLAQAREEELKFKEQDELLAAQNTEPPVGDIFEGIIDDDVQEEKDGFNLFEEEEEDFNLIKDEVQKDKADKRHEEAKAVSGDANEFTVFDEPEQPVLEYMVEDGKTLSLAEGVSEEGYTRFYNALADRGFGFTLTNGEGNVLRAMYNLISLGPKHFFDYADKGLKQVKTFDNDLFRQMVTGFDSYNEAYENNVPALEDSIKCVRQWLEAEERGLFSLLEDAYLKGDAKAFAAQYQNWEKSAQRMLRDDHYEHFYNDNVKQKLNFYRQEMAKVAPGDERFPFYQQVYRELMLANEKLGDRVAIAKEGEFFKDFIKNDKFFDVPPRSTVRTNELWVSYLAGEAAITKVSGQHDPEETLDREYLKRVLSNASASLKAADDDIRAGYKATLSDEDQRLYSLGGEILEIHTQAGEWMEKNAINLAYNPVSKAVSVSIPPEFANPDMQQDEVGQDEAQPENLNQDEAQLEKQEQEEQKQEEQQQNVPQNEEEIKDIPEDDKENLQENNKEREEVEAGYKKKEDGDQEEEKNEEEEKGEEENKEEKEEKAREDKEDGDNNEIDKNKAVYDYMYEEKHSVSFSDESGEADPEDYDDEIKNEEYYGDDKLLEDEEKSFEMPQENEEANNEIRADYLKLNKEYEEFAFGNLLGKNEAYAPVRFDDNPGFDYRRIAGLAVQYMFLPVHDEEAGVYEKELSPDELEKKTEKLANDFDFTMYMNEIYESEDIHGLKDFVTGFVQYKNKCREYDADLSVEKNGHLGSISFTDNPQKEEFIDACKSVIADAKDNTLSYKRSQVISAADLVIANTLITKAAETAFFSDDLVNRDKVNGDTLVLGNLTSKIQVMRKEIITDPIFRKTIAKGGQIKDFFENYKKELNRDRNRRIKAENTYNKSIPEAEKDQYNKFLTDNKIRLALGQIKAIKTAYNNLVEYNKSKSPSQHMENLMGALEAVVNDLIDGQTTIQMSKMNKLNQMALKYYDKRQGIFFGPQTDDGKSRLNEVEKLIKTTDKLAVNIKKLYAHSKTGQKKVEKNVMNIK